MAPINLGAPDLTSVILRTALPAVGGLSINAIYQGVDAFFVGKLGHEALAAVSLVLPLAGIPAAIGIGLGVGTATAIGRALGADQQAEAGRVASAAMGVCLGLAALASVLIWLNQDGLADLLGAEQAVKELALAYLNLMALSAGFGMVQILCDFTAIGEGNARFSLYTLVLCFSLNMALNPVLIFWAGLGVQGAALATVLAQGVTLTVYTLYFIRGWGRIRLRPVRDLAALARLRPVLAIGLPEALAVLLSSAAFVLIYRIAGALDGASGQAAMGLAVRLWFLASLPIQGFCLGAQPVIAHAVGALDAARLQRAVAIVATIALGASGVAMSVGLWHSSDLGWLFVTDPTVLALAKPAILALALSLPGVALRQTALITLQATTRARAAAILSLTPLGLLFLPLTLMLTRYWGFDGLSLALPATYLLSGAAAALILWRMPQFKLKARMA